jgi:anion-transporting  ArsA/GET3 family ATPase
MEPGFVARAKEVEKLLVDQRTTFIVVTTLEAAPAHEAHYLADELRRRNMPLGALVLNRVLPAAIRQPAANKAAGQLATVADDAELRAELAGMVGATADEVREVLAEVADRFHDTSVVAAREAERRRELAKVAPIVAEAPTMRDDIHDIAGLLKLGEFLL